MPRRWHNDYFLYLCKHEENLAHHIFLLVICLFSSLSSVGKPVANADSLLKCGEKEYMRLASSK